MYALSGIAVAVSTQKNVFRPTNKVKGGLTSITGRGKAKRKKQGGILNISYRIHSEREIGIRISRSYHHKLIYNSLSINFLIDGPPMAHPFQILIA